MRLDLYLTEQGLCQSRARAKRLIEQGAVTLNGIVIQKPSFEVVGEPEIAVLQERFVGRGGEKLEAALSLFGVDPTGLHALDIGASTGGFTDCLLQHGAAHVTAVDTGFGQLHESLVHDARVTNIEKYNARDLDVVDVGVLDLAVMDVSFISQTYILPRIPAVLTEDGVLISLIKPQFEAGRSALNKNGIVRTDRDRIQAIARVFSAAVEVGLVPVGLAPSPILGGDGNREFLACFKRQGVPLGPLMIEQCVWKGEVIV